MRIRRGIAAEHRRQTPGDAAAVDALRLVGGERLEHLLAFGVRQLVEGELVVIAHEVRPLRPPGGTAGRGGERGDQGRRDRSARARGRAPASRGSRTAGRAPRRARRRRTGAAVVRQVDFAEQRGIADASLQEALEVAQQYSCGSPDLDALRRLDEERARHRCGIRRRRGRARTRSSWRSRRAPADWRCSGRAGACRRRAGSTGRCARPAPRRWPPRPGRPWAARCLGGSSRQT